MLGNKIYDSANVSTTATVEGATGQGSLSSPPLGVVAGEVAMKTVSVGGTAPTGSATSANQATQITAEQAILAKIPAVGTAGTASSNVLSMQGVANGTALTVIDGAKPSTSTASPTRFTNLGADATKNVKASAGNVFAVVCDNANAAVRYLQLHNTATVPADQVVPVYSFRVQPASQLGVGEDIFSAAGVNFATGIAFAFSTTRDTYTAGTASDQSTVVHYK